MKNAPAELYSPPMKYRMRLKTRMLEALKGTSETTAATACARVRGIFGSEGKNKQRRLDGRSGSQLGDIRWDWENGSIRPMMILRQAHTVPSSG